MIGRVLLLIPLLAGTSAAHVGSPDVFYEGQAGPYRLSVVIRPPAVIPGVAEVEVRSGSPELQSIRVTTLKLTGAGAKYAPTPDPMQRSKDDPQNFTGSIWLMSSGSAQVRFDVQGPQGSGSLAVPVAAVAQRTLTMQKSLGVVLLVLMLGLSAGLIGIVGAAVRESTVPPGEQPEPARRRKARVAIVSATVAVASIIFLGNNWWSASASDYQKAIFRPLEMTPRVDAGDRLTLALKDPGWLRPRPLDDFLPDHGHLMHLYVVSLPTMERAWHLHPQMTEAGLFAQTLPQMPAGRYWLYGDLVDSTGLPETVVADLVLPQPITGHALEGDDAAGQGPAIGGGSNRAVLPDGTVVEWLRDGARPLVAKRLEDFRFLVVDAQGQPAQDVVPYMGMAGHAAFLKADGSTFAHIHPSGTVPMAALQLVSGKGAPHDGHGAMRLPPEIVFPYGFPQAGQFRVIVQFRRGERVETAMFDAQVGPR